jgi:hypothetical protein
MADFNEAFRKWFGQSKVADENGQPRVVYHGTSAQFSIFDTTRRRTVTGNVTSVWGSFFTPSEGEAQRYVHDFHQGKGHVIPVYLSLQNPYEMKRIEWDRFAMQVFFKQAASQEEAEQNARRFKEELVAAGHDGIVVLGRGFNAEYIAFYPEQIKSIGNDGTWDADDPNIGSNPSQNQAKKIADDYTVLEKVVKSIRGDLHKNGFKDMADFYLSVYTEEEVEELYVGKDEWVGQYVAGSVDEDPRGIVVLLRPWAHIEEDGSINWAEIRITILHELGHALWELLDKEAIRRWNAAIKSLPKSRWSSGERFADDFARFINGQKTSMELPELFEEITRNGQGDPNIGSNPPSPSELLRQACDGGWRSRGSATAQGGSETAEG